jgi:hypothetical protein
MICTGIHNVSVTFLKAISFISDLSFEQQPQLKFEIIFLTSDLLSLESLVFYFVHGKILHRARFPPLPKPSKTLKLCAAAYAKSAT